VRHGLDPRFADQPRLHDLGEHYVAKDREQKDRPIQQRQLRETELRGHRRKWKPYCDAHDNDGGDCELPARTALDEGQLLGGNDMNDQCLEAPRPVGLCSKRKLII
jgi:hypothetical protein